MLAVGTTARLCIQSQEPTCLRYTSRRYSPECALQDPRSLPKMPDNDKSSCYTSGEVGRRRAACLKEEESGEVWRRTPPTSMVGGGVRTKEVSSFVIASPTEVCFMLLKTTKCIDLCTWTDHVRQPRFTNECFPDRMKPGNTRLV